MLVADYLMQDDLKKLFEKQPLNQKTKKIIANFLQINAACIELKNIIKYLSFNGFKNKEELKLIDNSLEQIYITLMSEIPTIQREIHKKISDE